VYWLQELQNESFHGCAVDCFVPETVVVAVVDTFPVVVDTVPVVVDIVPVVVDIVPVVDTVPVVVVDIDLAVVEAETVVVVDVAEVDVVVEELYQFLVCVLPEHLGGRDQPVHVLDPVAGHIADHLG